MFSLAKALFKRCAVDFIMHLAENRDEIASKMRTEALEDVQAVTEAFISYAINDAVEEILHVQRDTLMLPDCYLVIRMDFYDFSVLQRIEDRH